MIAVFKTEKGEKVEVFLRSQLLEGKPWSDKIEIRPLNSKDQPLKRKIVPLVLDEDNRYYFEYKNSRIYVDNYEFDSLENIIVRIQKAISEHDRWKVSQDEMLATFMRDTDELAFVASLPVFDFIIPSLGIGTTGDNYVEMLCVPEIYGNYPKNEWGYKIAIKPENEKLRPYVANKSYYFSDFCHLIINGDIKVVKKSEYLQQQAEKERLQVIEDNKPINKVKKFFKIGCYKKPDKSHRVMIINP